MELQAIATDEVEKQNSRDPTQTSPVQTYYINFIKKTKGRLKSIAIPVCSDGVEFRDDVFFEKARKELGLNGWCHSHLPYYVLRVFYQITYVQVCFISNALCFMSYLIRCSTRSTSIYFMKVCNMRRIS